MPGKLLNLKKTGEVLGVTDRTVENLIERGLIRGFRVGARWRVEEAEITAYIERQKEKVDELVAQQLQEVREQDSTLVEEFEHAMAEFEQKLQQLPLDEQAQVVDHLLEIVKRTLVAK
jgi:excisionase family DNA binding protein